MRIRSRMGFIGQHWALVLLATLVAFQALNNWAWLCTSLTILGSDPRRHLMTALTYCDTLEPFNLGSLSDMITMDEHYPPLFQLSAAPLLWLSGRSTDVATMVNVLCLAVLLASTYAIGRAIFDSTVGFLASSVLSTFPTICGLSRYFYIDFALTAMVPLNLALLLYSQGFERKGYALLYGFGFGLGILVKWTLVVFGLTPAVLSLLRVNSRGHGMAIPDILRSPRWITWCSTTVPTEVSMDPRPVSWRTRSWAPVLSS